MDARNTIIGDSAVMRRLLDAVERVAPKDVTILVRGETGTGKELIASLVHARSSRSSGPFVIFNCGAVPAELAEAELFGHARGAFTGAMRERRGFFSEADRGTLVLDEVGELPLAIQAKLLRALHQGEIQPVGTGHIERVDVRVIASTNRDLEAATIEGRFREDLYYRLAVVELCAPPLRDRREDIPALVAAFARRFGDRFGHPVRLSPALLEALCQAEWPGNVRQLENTVARLAALDGGEEIGEEAFRTERARACFPERQLSLPELLKALEKYVIAQTLADASGNQSEAARRLGVARSLLCGRLKRYGLVTKA